jgi:hypothetical protein
MYAALLSAHAQNPNHVLLYRTEWRIAFHKPPLAPASPDFPWKYLAEQCKISEVMLYLDITG